ncbi:MAG: hypothetical protein WCO33_00340 [bacterium]
METATTGESTHSAPSDSIVPDQIEGVVETFRQKSFQIGHHKPTQTSKPIPSYTIDLIEKAVYIHSFDRHILPKDIASAIMNGPDQNEIYPLFCDHQDEGETIRTSLKLIFVSSAGRIVYVPFDSLSST